MEKVLVEKRNTVITLKVSLEELGTIITSLGRTSYDQNKESAQFNSVKIVTMEDKDILFHDLKLLYREAE